MPSLAFGQSSYLRKRTIVQETDSSPQAVDVTIIQVPSGGLTKTSERDVTLNYVPASGGIFDYIELNTSAGAPSFSEGRFYWDTTDKTISLQTDQTDVTLQVGQEFHVRVYNNTGSQIDNGEAVYFSGASNGRPSVALAQANIPDTSLFASGIATHDIADSSEGIVTLKGFVRGLDTSSLTAGYPVYISPTTAGGLTTTRPQYPNYRLMLGGCVTSDASNGVIYIEPREGIESMYDNGWNGNFLEPFDFTVSSNGTTITGALEQSGGGDLIMNFSTGQTVLDCTPASTVTLTAGSATVPTYNWIYIPISTKVLTVATGSTEQWPSEEHIKIATVLVLDAATTQTIGGGLIDQNRNDHIAGTDKIGHIHHIAHRLRLVGAQYESGVEPTINVTTNVGVADNVDLALSSGYVYQLHKQTFPAFDTSSGDTFFVINDSSTPYTTASDLADLLTDADGDTLESSYFSFVIWGVANKTGQPCPVFVNLPTGSYSNSANAINDTNNEDVYTIPAIYRNVGFYIARVTLRHQAASGGTWTVVQTEDLRGTKPNSIGGGSVLNAVTSFSDNTFAIFNNTDSSKIATFDASAITTATTRAYTFLDTDGVMALSDAVLTEGSIPFVNSSTQLDEDNSNLFWDNSNKFLALGITSPLGIIHAQGEGASNTRLYFDHHRTASGSYPGISLRKSRGDSGTPTTVINGDGLGVLEFYGYDGSTYLPGAYITSAASGTVATNQLYGRIAFSTNNGSTSAFERVSISPAGYLGVALGTGVNASYPLDVNGAIRNYNGQVEFGASTTYPAGTQFTINGQNYRTDAGDLYGVVSYGRVQHRAVGTNYATGHYFDCTSDSYAGVNVSILTNLYCVYPREVGSGTVNHARNIRAFTPAVGIYSNAAIMTDNLVVGAGYDLNSPPSNGALIQGPVGIGVFPASQLTISPAGEYDGTDYGKAITTIRSASNTAVHIAMIRAGNAVWGLGFVYNTNTFGIFDFPSATESSNTSPALSIAQTTKNVGIGTASALANLHVNNDFHIAANSGSWNSTAGKGIFMRYSTNATQDQAYIQSIDRATTTTYPMYFEASKFYFQTGNVGIGTTTPAYGLDVDGTFFHTTYNTASIPASAGTGGLVVSWNRTGGQAEVNLYNVYEGASQSFTFSQKTGTSTYVDLMNMTTSKINVYKYIEVNLGGTSASSLVLLSGNSANYTGLSIGRTAAEAHMQVPSGSGQWISDATAGDIAIRVDDSSKAIRFHCGTTGNTTFGIYNGKVRLNAGAYITEGGSSDIIFQNSSGTQTHRFYESSNYGRMEVAGSSGMVLSGTSGAALAQVYVYANAFSVINAGANEFTAGSGGCTMGSPTGGLKGLGTLNLAGDIYKNNSAYTNPDYVFELKYTGNISRIRNEKGELSERALNYSGRKTLSEIKSYTQTHHRLPGIDNKPMGMFERSDILLEKMEEAYLYLIEMKEAIDQNIVDISELRAEVDALKAA